MKTSKRVKMWFISKSSKYELRSIFIIQLSVMISGCSSPLVSLLITLQPILLFKLK